MKNLTSAFILGALLFVLAGCCCDSGKACNTKHPHTAQCSGSECTDEKKDNSHSSETACADTQEENQSKKENTQPQGNKISAR